MHHCTNMNIGDKCLLIRMRDRSLSFCPLRLSALAICSVLCLHACALGSDTHEYHDATVHADNAKSDLAIPGSRYVSALQQLVHIASWCVSHFDFCHSVISYSTQPALSTLIATSDALTQIVQNPERFIGLLPPVLTSSQDGLLYDDTETLVDSEVALANRGAPECVNLSETGRKRSVITNGSACPQSSEGRRCRGKYFTNLGKPVVRDCECGGRVWVCDAEPVGDNRVERRRLQRIVEGIRDARWWN